MSNIVKLRMVFCLLFTGVPSRSVAAELPGDSLYQVGSDWTNQDGEKIQLIGFRGHPLVLSLVYLSCGYTCPTIVSEIDQMLKKIDPKARERTKIVLISFDPVRDTPKAMKAFFKKRKINDSDWSLLTNKDESKIRELAAALNFKYQKTAGGEFTHSFMIATLDSDGVLKARVDAANKDKTALISSLNSVVRN